MRKKKQIEELANFLWHNTLIHTEDLCHDVAETVIIAGYRKQSVGEWISVEERLPEESGDYITYHNHGHCGVIYYNASIHLWNVYYFEYTQNAIRSVTHWMPLPEPPKGE